MKLIQVGGYVGRGQTAFIKLGINLIIAGQGLVLRKFSINARSRHSNVNGYMQRCTGIRCR